MRVKEFLYMTAGLVVGIGLGMFALGGDDAVDEETLQTVVQQIVAAETGNLQVKLDALTETVSGLSETSITGTRLTREVVAKDFFLVSFDEVAGWLESVDSSDTETALLTDELRTALENVEGLGSASDFGVYFTEQSDSVSSVLATVYNVLFAQTNADADNAEAITVCLGLDNNPYSITGPGLYIYVEIIEELSNEIPKGWEELETAKENDMLWSSECYIPGEEETES